MGETAADTRREIVRTRGELGRTVQALKSRTVQLRSQTIRIGVVAGGALAAAGAVAGSVLLIRHRRGGRITGAARRLPDPARATAVPMARSTERWLDRRSKRLAKEREEVLESMSARIAEHQADAERRANPIWRRTAAKALETAAAVSTAALIRRAMSEPQGLPDKSDGFRPDAEPETKVVGSHADPRQPAAVGESTASEPRHG